MSSIYDQVPALRIGGRRLAGRVAFGLMVLAAALMGAFGGLLVVYSTDLSEVQQLETFRPSSITELYDDQGKAIGSFALQRRVIASYDDFPQVLRDAVISIEDKNFDSHWGVNLWRVLGAAYRDLSSGSRAQGASTLTMQLSRNLFLTQERALGRKIEEIMLAIQIERRFTKPQIFTMYANQIFLGHGVYGFEAGAQFYFSKHARDLTLEEAALLAGLPKAPSSYSPLVNMEKAMRRRNLVINAMLEDGKITAREASRAKDAPVVLNLQHDPNFLAPYFTEEIRQYLEKKYGSDRVQEAGLRVYTSLNAEMQHAANRAVLDGLASYERRHGWKGHLRNLVAAGEDLSRYNDPDWNKPMEPGSYVHALVTEVGKNSATVRFAGYSAQIGPAEMAWTGIRSPKEILTVGDLAYVRIKALPPGSGPHVASETRVTLEQESGVQGALLALDNTTGDIKAMVGGRDFDDSKFNRATQAMRQVGSSFKPYVYSAAIEEGASPSDTVLDAPVTFSTASGPYTPHNYDGRYEGMITLARALSQSRNIPALKIAERVSIHKVIDYARRFGVTSNLPPVLPLAIGAAEISLAEQTAAFTTFPNEGVRVVPRYIRKVTDAQGNVLEENEPEVREVISARTARIMTGLLQQVVEQGTATAARSLDHPLGGKTGTTNDYTDAWFVGFSPSITCGVWMGFDEKKSLGERETGAQAALPIWINFMRTALKGREKETFFPGQTDDPQALVSASLPKPKAAGPAPEYGPMVKFLRWVMLGMVLLTVALISALAAMRLAIHGREVVVPSVVGLSPEEAEQVSVEHGLLVVVGNHYYSSSVAAGRIMSQMPGAGATVRRGWRLHLAESMGPQHVLVPNVVGQSLPAAEVTLRRHGLEVGSVAEIPYPDTAQPHQVQANQVQANQVLAQTPAPNAEGIAGPRMHLLVSVAPVPAAYLMPRLIGRPLSDAVRVLNEAGMKVRTNKDAPAEGSPADVTAQAADANASTAPAPAGPEMVVAQTPAPGSKIIAGTTVELRVH